MTVLSFIKENRVLVAGLVLPLLLVGIFAIAKTIPASMIDPPQYKVIYFARGWGAKGQISFKVSEDGRPIAIFEAAQGYKSYPNEQQPKSYLYIFDPKTNKVENIDVVLDKDDKPNLPESIANLHVSKEFTSPDGYMFEPYRNRNNSLIIDIFGYRSYDNNPVLINDGNVIQIPAPNSPYYGAFEFLGWVTEGTAK